MKTIHKLILLVSMLYTFAISSYALSDNQTNSVASDTPRMFDLSKYHNSCRMWLRCSNFGFIGSGDDVSPRWPSLEYPGGSGVDYLYQGSLWIGAKKYRRNAAGTKLYWATYPPTNVTSVIEEGASGWNANLKPVLDTLTTVGFDGDKNLYELLPAYNPLESAIDSLSALYNQYNSQDCVMKSILSNPSPRPFAMPDPLGTYCFTIPTGQTGNEPGFETLTGFYYDYSPFGIVGQRDWGTSTNSSYHVPLNIAFEQKSYAFPLQNYFKLVIIKYTLFNASLIDTLFDVNIGNYMDCDCGPQTYGPERAVDDISGYVMGTFNGVPYEFAYSRDADGDGGLTPSFVGSKIFLPGGDYHQAAWYWKVGKGPSDFYPQTIPANPSVIANEKYWLMTDRNPRTNNDYARLRGGPSGDLPWYEQPLPCDTRYLIGYYGNQPTVNNPNPPGRLNLDPLGNLTIYLAVFAGDNLEEMKQNALLSESLVNSNFNLGSMDGLTSIPYLVNAHQTSEGEVTLNWTSYTNPAHFSVMHKLSNAPDTQWQIISVPGTASNFTISSLTDGQSYKFKVVSGFNQGTNEVSLESNTQELTINNANSNQDNALPQAAMLSNYPNPFNPETTIVYDVPVKSNVTLSVYNIKGQSVGSLLSEIKEPGRYELNWSGKDRFGKALASGIYYCLLSYDNKVIMRKMLLLK